MLQDVLSSSRIAFIVGMIVWSIINRNADKEQNKNCEVLKKLKEELREERMSA